MPRVYQTRTVHGLLRDMRRQQRIQGTASPLTRSGLSVPEAGVTQVDGSLDVIGDLDVSGSASFSGDTTIGGDAAITGTLSLPAGIIDNDALSHPVDVDGSGASAIGYNVSQTASAKATVVLTPPTWCDKAVVLAVGDASAVNTSASLGYLTANIVINTSGGGTASQPASGSNGSGSVAVSAMRVLNPGSTVTVNLQVWSQITTFGTNGSNIANLNVIAVYLRA